MRILLVDDDRASRRLLERILQRWNYEVESAADGLEAFHILQENPDLALLITDWTMPRMNGLELCRQAREMARDRYLHIIMLTVREDKCDELECLEVGADAFLTKPVDPHELKVHLKVAERMITLEDKLATKVLELDKAHSALQQEIESAGKIQRSLLPTVSPEIQHIDTAWAFHSCNETAGDMLNVVRLDEHHLGIYILDVSGHGCQAALLSVSLSRVLNPYPQQGGILKIFTETGKRYRIPSPAEVAKDLNRRFPVMRQSGQFFTFMYGILNIQTLTFTYTRAGHPPQIHHRDGSVLNGEDTSAVPLGIMEEPDYRDHSMVLAPGDLILFLTDGFEEAKNKAGTEFGRGRLEQLLSGRKTWPIHAAIATVETELNRFTQGAPRLDDMTMVGFSIHPDKMVEN